MAETQNQVHITADAPEIIVRTGDAPKVYDPERVVVTGDITAPRAFYDTRKGFGQCDRSFTHVLVDRQSNSIKLVCREDSRFGAVILGHLSLSPEYQALGINSGEAYTPEKLGKTLRGVRYLFSDKNEGMALVSELMNFKASVDAEVAQSKDTRGNKENRLAVAVKSNLPLGFRLKLPVWKGSLVVDLNVEIVLESRGHAVDCYLESAEASELIATSRDTIINLQLGGFLTDGVTVMEV